MSGRKSPAFIDCMERRKTTIPPARASLRRLRLGVLLAVAFMFVWWALRPQPNVVTSANAPVAPAPTASAVARPPSPFSDAPPVPGQARSPLEERAARLGATASAEPQDPAVARTAYRSALERYAALRSRGATPAQLDEVARILDAGIDARVDRGEMTLADGMELMADLLDVLEPDPRDRGPLLAQWREQKLAAGRPRQPRDPGLVSREAVLVAAWQARPAARRDAHELEWAIQQLSKAPLESRP
jgi:hypothetical protein